jgi:uncharacterized protein YbjT (DUF2867 family)
MKIIVTGSLGNISKPLTQALVAAGHQVVVISSNKDKTEAIEALGATAAIGSLEDADFLTGIFSGADAVYTMLPPGYAEPDYRGYFNRLAKIYADAITRSGVKRVVNLSSIGAHLPGGTGPIAGIYDVEQLFNTLEGVNIVHLRASFFYTNFFGNIDMIKHAGIIGGNYGENALLVMVDPADIAHIAAEELQKPFTGKSFRYVASDERTTSEIAAAIGKAIGKPQLPWVNFTDEQTFDGLQQAGLPVEISNKYVEMGTAVRSGILWEDYNAHKPIALQKTKLEDFAERFAAVYNA